MRLLLTMLLAAMPAIAGAQPPAAQEKPTGSLRPAYGLRPTAYGLASVDGFQAKPAQPTEKPTQGTTASKPAQGTAAAKPAQPAPAQAPPAVPDYTPDKYKLSYALGMDIGSQFKERSMDVDPAVFAKGMHDSLAGAKTELTVDEARATIAELQKYLAAKKAQDTRMAGDKNQIAGEAFLAANKSKPGVVTLKSGVQYKVITMGTGRKPALTDHVVCHYRGTTIDGQEFDSSLARKEPATFPVQRVIPGWTEVLQLMPVGSKWQVFIPSNLAYGERGAGGGIGPNATLVFEIELLGIK